MTDCNYCTAEFKDNDEYIQHLVDEHKPDLSRIDEQKVRQHDAIDLNPELTLKGMAIQTGILLGILAVIAILLYVFFM